MYSSTVMDHFKNPRNVGEIENPDGMGEVGNPLCGDMMSIYLKIEEDTIKGWGFPRYYVSKLGEMAGTLMAIDPNAPKVNRFVTLGEDPYLIRYNSRLPIVVYVPEGVEVRYRIWRAEAEVKAMGKG